MVAPILLLFNSKTNSKNLNDNIRSHFDFDRKKLTDTAKKWSFPLRISSETVTKSAVSYGFGYIYKRNS